MVSDDLCWFGDDNLIASHSKVWESVRGVPTPIQINIWSTRFTGFR